MTNRWTRVARGSWEIIHEIERRRHDLNRAVRSGDRDAWEYQRHEIDLLADRLAAHERGIPLRKPGI